MSDKWVDLRKLVDLGMKKDGQTYMRPVIEKELLHYDILFVLDKERLLDKLTFQGGTSLRLCYGAVRYSEGLDFVGGYDFDIFRDKRLKLKLPISRLIHRSLVHCGTIMIFCRMDMQIQLLW